MINQIRNFTYTIMLFIYLKVNDFLFKTHYKPIMYLLFEKHFYSILNMEIDVIQKTKKNSLI